MTTLCSLSNYGTYASYKKCGEILRSPTIGEKTYALLCLYCHGYVHDITTFMVHLEKEHEDSFKDPRSKDDAVEDILNFGLQNYPSEYGKRYEPVNICKEAEGRESTNSIEETDPLEEDGCCGLPEIIQNVEKEMQMQKSPKEPSANKFAGDSVNDGTGTDSNDSVSDEEFEPDKDTDEDDNYCDDDEDNNEDAKLEEDYIGVVKCNSEEGCSSQNDSSGNLKHFSKNRSFIRTLIDAYKQQHILWDLTYKCRNPQKRDKAYMVILNEVNGKYNTNATTKQIEIIIRRLRLRFINQYRKNNNNSDDKSCSPLWFYDQLKFIEPHISGIKQNSRVCQKLTDEQLLTLIGLVKNNECLWNEHNIYHTSVIYRQESLQNMTLEFNSQNGLENITANEMKSLVGELKEMATEENKQISKESKTLSEYKSSNKFYKELLFLLPHVGPFNCDHCKKSFVDVYTYKFHVAKHAGTKAFKCMLCQKELTHKKEFMCHLRRHTKECPFKCEFCDKSFPSKKEWQRHVIKHGSKPYICELCADSFYTQHQLTNHKKNHANIRDHVCPQCGKGFTHRGLLRQHLQTHNKNECRCPICNNVYANPRSLRKHYVRVHEVSQDSSTHLHNCEVCAITFPTIQEAKQHRKEHRQSLPAKRKHTCDICGHDFAYPRNLADHKKIHSNIRDQVCNVCGKAFTNSNLLNQHKNVHNGQKFVCKSCGKDYAHYRGLCRHISKVHGSNIKELCGVIQNQ